MCWFIYFQVILQKDTHHARAQLAALPKKLLQPAGTLELFTLPDGPCGCSWVHCDLPTQREGIGIDDQILPTLAHFLNQPPVKRLEVWWVWESGSKVTLPTSEVRLSFDEFQKQNSALHSPPTPATASTSPKNQESQPVIDLDPNYHPPVSELRQLVDHPLSHHNLATFARSLGRELSVSDETYSITQINRVATLIIASDGASSDVISCAILSFCWLDLAHSVEDQSKFGSIYQTELDRASRLIGPPNLQGRDTDDTHRHRWALWIGACGILILQQSAYDLQFGLDINYWITPKPSLPIQPIAPFIEWLMRLPTVS